MTEVPEHLLQRSRDRRAALGGGSAAPSAPAGGGGGDDSGGGGSAAPVPAAAAAAPIVAEPAAPPPPPPPYVQAALDRKKMPGWMAGAGVLTLLWAFVYAGVLFTSEGEITDPVLAEGQEIYASQCAGCHGGSGQGATGRPLAGQVYLTFPDIQDHIAWITNGSPAPGTPYGDPNRPGGQHISQDGWGAMPAFGGSLTEEQILAVARYEREVLDSAPPPEGSVDTAEGGDDSGADDPTNAAETEGGDADQSTASDEGSGGSGETQGAEEDSTGSGGGPEGDANVDPDASGE